MKVVLGRHSAISAVDPLPPVGASLPSGEPPLWRNELVEGRDGSVLPSLRCLQSRPRSRNQCRASIAVAMIVRVDLLGHSDRPIGLHIPRS